MNIVLIGLRGSGKTTLGTLLALKLKRRFIDIDDVIAEQTGRLPRDIIEHDGWDVFRKREKKAIASLARARNAVIATGGGAVMDDDNAAILKKHGVMILFHAPLSLLAVRTVGDDTRPSLRRGADPVAEIHNVWNERKNRYMELADMIFEVHDTGPRDNADRLFRQLLEQLSHALS